MQINYINLQLGFFKIHYLGIYRLEELAEMKGTISILDFDHTYSIQNFFKNIDYEWIRFLDIKNTSRYCEEESLLEIYRRLRERRNRGITFIGSGNHHYITYLLMKEIKYPFTLILFDHHSDMLKPYFQVLISCGSWVLNALDNIPMLKKVIIIGVKEELARSIPFKYNGVVSYFTKEDIDRSLQIRDIKGYIDLEVLTDSIYISIDKDVLVRSESVTNWDHGDMKLEQLLSLLDHISNKRQICGVDICGEYPYNPVENHYRESIRAIEKNNRANLEILNRIKAIEFRL